MKTFPVTIPAKGYTRKFIHKRYGCPVPINNSTLVGVVVSNILEKKKVYNDISPVEAMEQRYQRLTDRIELVITAGKFFHMALSPVISKEKVIAINRFWEALFEEELHMFCQKNIVPGRYSGYDKALDKFADLYKIDFDVDITFDALKKMEYRFRKKLELNSSVNVPSGKELTQSSMF